MRLSEPDTQHSIEGHLDRLLRADLPAEVGERVQEIRESGLAQPAAQALALMVSPKARWSPLPGFLGLIIRRPYKSEARQKALSALSLLRQPIDITPLIEAIWDRRHPDIRRRSAETLAELALLAEEESALWGHSIHALTVALRHRDKGVRLAAAQGLGRLSAQTALEALVARLEVEKDSSVRNALALAIGSLQSRGAVLTLLDSYENGEITADACLQALSQMGQAAVGALLGAARRWNLSLVSRQMATQALGQIGSESALITLLEIARRPHEPEAMRQAVVEALGGIGNIQARPVLVGIYREPGISEALRQATREAIDRLAHT